jgi:hypothetical protein
MLKHLRVRYARRVLNTEEFGLDFLSNSRRTAAARVQRTNEHVRSNPQFNALRMRYFGTLRFAVCSLQVVLAHEELAGATAHHARAFPAVVTELYHTAVALPQQLQQLLASCLKRKTNR